MIEAAGSYAGTYYYHFDGSGNVVALTNSSGNTVEVYEYDVYGKVGASDASHPNRFMFTGREFDKETGLYYYRARYYKPEIGRFLQADPVGLRGGMNLYAYCMNRPTMYTDPMGLCAAYPRPRPTPPVIEPEPVEPNEPNCPDPNEPNNVGPNPQPTPPPPGSPQPSPHTPSPCDYFAVDTWVSPRDICQLGCTLLADALSAACAVAGGGWVARTICGAAAAGAVLACFGACRAFLGREDHTHFVRSL